MPEAGTWVADLRRRAAARSTSSAAALAGWLAAPDDLRERTREAIVAATRERYSWDGVARTVIAAARGELDDLPRPCRRAEPPPERLGFARR